MFVRNEDKKILGLGELKKEHKNVSFPAAGPETAWLEEHGYAVVDSDEQPEIKPGQSYKFADKAKEVDGKWVRPAEVIGEAVVEHVPTRHEKIMSELPDPWTMIEVLLKQLNHDRLNGKELIQEADDLLGKWLAAQDKHPKEDKAK